MGEGWTRVRRTYEVLEQVRVRVKGEDEGEGGGWSRVRRTYQVLEQVRARVKGEDEGEGGGWTRVRRTYEVLEQVRARTWVRVGLGLGAPTKCSSRSSMVVCCEKSSTRRPLAWRSGSISRSSRILALS